jgi:trans-aconitate methyltransferase
MADVEESHWWYRALRGRVVADLAADGLRDGDAVLDAGCGTGGTWRALSRRWPALDYTGFDPAEEALGAARAAGAPRLARAGLDDAPPVSQQRAVLSLDTLYYAADEAAALARLRAALRPGGLLVLNLPAFDCARGRHDAAVGVTRRYRRARVASLLTGAGFAVERCEYWNSALFPVALAWRAATRSARGEARSDLAMPPAPLNAALAGWLSLEGRLGRLLPPPFGLSVYALARR